MLKYSINFNIQYLELLINEINNMYAFHLYCINQLRKKIYLYNSKPENNKKFTKEELSYYNGTKGKPAYVAVNEIVYDVSLEPAWGGGTHFKIYSGKDLSIEFNSCHNTQLLEKLAKVGTLID